MLLTLFQIKDIYVMFYGRPSHRIHPWNSPIEFTNRIQPKHSSGTFCFLLSLILLLLTCCHSRKRELYCPLYGMYMRWPIGPGWVTVGNLAIFVLTFTSMPNLANIHLISCWFRHRQVSDFGTNKLRW